MNGKNFLLMISIAYICASFPGCKQDTSTPIEPVVTSLKTYQPKGTITGLIKNRTTDAPVPGAVISIGYDGVVHATTSNVAGAFSFADVPVGQYQIVNGTSVLSGTYTLTVSLVDYNSSQTDQAKKYRNYYYTTTTIRFTSLAAGDSVAISDMVGSVLLPISYLNTTVVGLVVDQKAQPVANAVVSLYDATVVPNVVLAQAQTQADGSYQFTKVDNGLTILLKAASADGSLEGSLASSFTLPSNITADSMRSQVLAERIVLAPVDNVSPSVVSITPENNADVAPANLQIVYTFSEPIKQTAYTRTDLALGHGTMLDDIVITYIGLKKITGPTSFSAQWNSTFTQFTITPQGLISSARYSASIQTAFSSGKITDVTGRVLINNALLTGDFELLQFTTSGNSTVPNAPTLSRRNVIGVYPALDYLGGNVGLAWNFDNNARSYNIYKSINGGSFELLAKDVYGVQYAENSGSLVIPVGASNPLSSASVRYLVRAVSKDLVEGPASNVITVGDDVAPTLTNVAITPYLSSSNNSYAILLRFSEPLNQASAQLLGNYTFSNPDTVTIAKDRADYLGYSISAGGYLVQLQVSTGQLTLPAGYSFAISNVFDLAGNSVNPSQAKYVTVPAQTFPSLPVNGQTGVPAIPTFSWKPANAALTYHLQISSNPSFTSIVKDTQNITSTSASFPGLQLLSGTTYYWRIFGQNTAGEASNYTSYSFTTLGPAPTLSLPLNSAINVSTTPTFSWTATAGATSYIIEVATDNAFTTKQTQTSVGSTLLWPSLLSAATNYWWRVTAVNPTTGASTVSAVSTFRTL